MRRMLVLLIVLSVIGFGTLSCSKTGGPGGSITGGKKKLTRSSDSQGHDA